MENKVLSALEAINSELNAALRKVAEQRGLSLTQANIINYIGANQGETISGIANKLALSKPTVSDSVKSLRKKSLVGHTESARDSRIKNLALTKEGEQVYAYLESYRNNITEKLGKLHMSERSILFESLNKAANLIKATS